MPQIATCPEGCTALAYVAGRCDKHGARWVRIYITEGEKAYILKILRDQKNLLQGKYGLGAKYQLEFFKRELDRLKRISPDG